MKSLYKRCIKKEHTSIIIKLNEKLNKNNSHYFKYHNYNLFDQIENKINKKIWKPRTSNSNIVQANSEIQVQSNKK